MPNISVVNNPNSICKGDSASITASGANTYTWSTGANSASIIVSPTVTTQYTVTGTGTNSCLKKVIANLSVNPLPTVTVNSATTCAGVSTSLTASGTLSYTWNTGATGPTISPTLTTTTNYTVVGANGSNCHKAATATITVNPLPNISAVSDSNNLCIGNTTTLTASGGTTYTWSTGQNGASISITPTITTNYTVIGRDANGCVNSDTVTQIVNNCSMNTKYLLSNNKYVIIYPNPTSDQFYIETNATDKLNVDLYDVNGRHVFSASVNDKENINVATLDNGSYTLTIKTADRVINKKLIILR